jgi:hypothetical protein
MTWILFSILKDCEYLSRQDPVFKASGFRMRGVEETKYHVRNNVTRKRLASRKLAVSAPVLRAAYNSFSCGRFHLRIFIRPLTYGVCISFESRSFFLTFTIILKTF